MEKTPTAPIIANPQFFGTRDYLISNLENIVYELPHVLSNDISLRVLKCWKNLTYGFRQLIVPSLLTRNKTLVLVVKNYAK